MINNPSLFFFAIESQFVIRGVTVQQKKFHYVVSGLPALILERIPDLLETPYDVFKARILRIFHTDVFCNCLSVGQKDGVMDGRLDGRTN